MINKDVTHGNTCKLYNCITLPQPAVILAKPIDFNDTIAMDLYQLGKRWWYLYFTDKLCRFNNATITWHKDPNLVTKNKLNDNGELKHWTNLFGSPKNKLNDNGGKFVSTDFIDFCKNFNIKVKTTTLK